MRARLFLAAPLGLVLVLAACSAPTPVPPVDTAFSVPGTVYTEFFDPDLVPIGVSLFLIRDDVIGSMSVDTSSFVEVFDTFFVGPISPVAADGSFELVFPDGDDVPAATMVPADDFAANARGFAACEVAASNAAASVTVTVWEFVSVPGMFTFSVEGAAPMAIFTEPIDTDDPPDPSELAFVTWVYADADVDVATGAGCAEASFELIVDVSLEAGWNQLEWTIAEGEGGDPDVLTLSNSSADEVHAYILFGVVF